MTRVLHIQKCLPAHKPKCHGHGIPRQVPVYGGHAHHPVAYHAAHTHAHHYYPDHHRHVEHVHVPAHHDHYYDEKFYAGDCFQRVVGEPGCYQVNRLHLHAGYDHAPC